jgi:hypothetical protein
MVVEELGSDAYAYGNLHLGPEAGVPDDKMFIARVDARRPPPKGETIHLRIRKSEEHVFNPETGGAREPRRSLPRQPLTVTRLGRARAPCGADRRGQVMGAFSPTH